MRYLQETTVWETEYCQPNHIYIVEDGRSGRLLGYIKQGTTEQIMFSKPVMFDRRYRTFKELRNIS